MTIDEENVPMNEEDVQCGKDDDDDGNGDNKGTSQSSVASTSVFGNKQQNVNRGKGVELSWTIVLLFKISWITTT